MSHVGPKTSESHTKGTDEGNSELLTGPTCSHEEAHRAKLCAKKF